MQHIVLIETVALDRIVADTLTQGQVDNPFRREEVINQADVVCLLAFQIGITIGDAGRICLIHIGIQIGNTRTADTHIVGQTDILIIRQGIREIGRGHQIAIIHLEILSLPHDVLHILPSMLIAHATFQTPLAPTSVILRIASQDVVLVLVVQATCLVIDILPVVIQVIFGI